MKKLLFIINPSAGKKHIKGRLFEIVDQFVKSDYQVRVHPTQAKGDATEIIKREGTLYDQIVCAGGDGTLDEVVTGCMQCGCDTPIGYIPCGTTNDFARSLGIPKDPIRAARRITKYQPEPIDIGVFFAQDQKGEDGEMLAVPKTDYFVYVAAFGAFTDVTYTTPQEYKNHLGHMAYVLEGIRSIPTLTSYRLKVTYDGQEIEEQDYFIGMVTNSLTVGGFQNPNSKIAELDDGLFEVLLVKYPTNPLDLQATVSAYMMGEFNKEYMYQFKAKRIMIESAEPIAWTLDGEYGGTCTKVEVVNEHHALKIVKK